MQDFNLRPEITGFGRPERLLKAEVAAAPPPPADQWKPSGKDFEVNGLGQLRTVLALPASEAEIAADMRHVDAPPMWIGVDPGFSDSYAAIWGSVPDRDSYFKKVWLHGSFDQEPIESKTPGTDAVVRGMLAAIPQLKAAQDRLNVEMLAACGKVLDAQNVPQRGRFYWNGSELHDIDSCQCDNCIASRQGRFQPQSSDDRRPLAEIIGSRRQPDLTSSQATAKTVAAALREKCAALIVKLATKEGAPHTRLVLREFGVDHFAAVPAFRHAKLAKRLQDDLDIPF